MIKLFLFISLGIFTTAVKAQIPMDTLSLNDIQSYSKFEDLYDRIPPGYEIKTFVTIIRKSGIDPFVQFNRGVDFTADTKEHLSRLGPGDILIVDKVYAINLQKKSGDEVLLPKRRIYIR